MILKGSGKLLHNRKEYNLTAGETILLPADLDNIKIQGNLTLLKTYIPDSRKRVKQNLLNQGFSRSEINNLPGFKNYNSW